MWPWEHLAVGYVCYSLYSRAVRGEPPSHSDALVLAVATQIPDLVDKPLAWVFGVLPSGLSLGHSIVIGIPVCLAVLAVTRRSGHAAAGSAYCIGFITHVAGDLFYHVALGGWPDLRAVLWPLASPPTTSTQGFLARVGSLWQSFEAFAATPRGQLYFLLEAVFLAVTLLLWTTDGRPGLVDPRRVSDRNG